MEEQHQPQFRGVWIPADIMNMQATGTLKAADVILLTIIDSLVAPEHGCYASNEYLAKRVGTHPRKVQARIAKLKEMGIVKQIKFDGKRRHLETTWSRLVGLEVPKTAPLTCRKRHPSYKVLSISSLSGPTGTDGDGDKNVGFGIAPPKNGKATKFDMEIAEQLYDAVKTLKPERTSVRCAKPSTWANHIRLIRVSDKVPEDTISKVAGWYAGRIGGEYIPEAFGGAAFRQKFPAIEKMCNKDITTTKVGSEAHVVAERLSHLAWPKGASKSVPNAVQASLAAYRNWLTRRDVFYEQLHANDLKGDYGPERDRLLKFAEHLRRTMAPPPHFIRLWMEDVHKRVCGWGSWSGDFSMLVFKPSTPKFTAMGESIAEDYAGDRTLFQRFCEVMEKEVCCG